VRIRNQLDSRRREAVREVHDGIAELWYALEKQTENRLALEAIVASLTEKLESLERAFHSRTDHLA
jgi:hypothetical protein